MALYVQEIIPLSRFIYEANWTPLKGTYLYPLKFFAPDRTVDPNDYLEVVRIIAVTGTNIAITRGGGLFVRNRDQYQTRAAIDELAKVFNLLLAEFALEGLVSLPITDVEIQDAKLIGRHASITGGWGDFADRTWGPYALLASPVRDLGKQYGQPGNDYWATNFYWVPHDPSILERIDGTPKALRLRDISSTLPTFVVAAAYHATRHNLPEGIITAWIVCEEILSFLWDQYVSQTSGKERRDRLADHRTYSAAVRLELLLTAGVLQLELYDLLNEARKVRNALAHRAAISQDAASACNKAMRETLKYAGVSVEKLPGYVFSSGGIGGPYKALEPEFKFE